MTRRARFIARPYRCGGIHREQVTAVRKALGPSLREVQTANRFQGLERKVIVALHPLSGKHRPTELRFATPQPSRFVIAGVSESLW